MASIFGVAIMVWVDTAQLGTWTLRASDHEETRSSPEVATGMAGCCFLAPYTKFKVLPESQKYVR